MILLRQVAELRARYIKAVGVELRTPIFISGAIPGSPEQVQYIDRYAIYNGLPELPAIDDEFGLDYVPEPEDILV
jgi:hypothetical protein